MAAAGSLFRRPPQRGPKKHLVSLAFAAAIFAAVLTSTRRDLFAQVKAPEVVPRPSAKKHHEAMTVVQLKEELRRRGSTVSGRKAELVARLEELASQDVSEEATAPKAAVPQPRREAAQEAFAAGAAGNPEEDVKKWAEKRVQYSEMLEKRSGGAVELYKEADERLAAYFRDFPEMQAALRPQQVHSVKECLVRRGRCLNADEMGLGKTLSSLVVAQVYSEEWPMLVVAPTTVVQNWVKEVKKWLPHLAEEVQEINSQFLKPERKDLLDAWVKKLIFVVSYDQLWRNPALGMQPDGSPYQVVIVDEAHFIKNSQTRRAQALFPICRLASRCILLTGTPVLNYAGETWSLMHALDPTLPTFENFCERYCDFKTQTDEDGVVTRTPFGVRRPEELHEVFGSFLVRQKKSDVLTDLAEKSKFRLNFRARIDGKHVQKIIAYQQRAAASKNPLLQRRIPQKIFGLTAQAKAVPVTEYVRSVLENSDPDCKLVVFGHHMVILNSVQKMLQKIGRRFVRLDGSVAQSRRQALLEEFQEDPEVQVALVGIMACGQGISLVAAHKVIFAELYWVPARLIQAEDRVHRHGQDHDVEIVYCVVEGKPFMDDMILSKLAQKEQIANLITDGKELDSAFTPLLLEGD